MGILPKEYQEEILKMRSVDKKLEYESTRNYVLSLAQQRASSMQPKPSDVLGVDGGGSSTGAGASPGAGNEEQPGVSGDQ
eukprot:12400262-Karenia_brevis.AAC.1